MEMIFNQEITKNGCHLPDQEDLDVSIHLVLLK